jgi:hypothetical protein
VVEKQVKHRLAREAKVVKGLGQLGASVIEELVKVVYDDVDVSLHKMASLSLHAHLIKLEQEERAVSEVDSGCWKLTDAR